ncbi:cysteine--tRNA ligase [Xanthobacter autotrophicus]|uniref:cysteine--tRNA ligase n=1 Tax=Xanthobacter autotrophicus TaxID=280 RepID=UPI0024A68125|nr:cysteine--tRNA ligase [Xanthobacter autotrophicus]MDI4657706.1 cysteine--tRNA ligase [Xanthobacter autotrophicus]
MELRLYNTLTRSKDTLRPLDPANVRMYVCGPTVYDHAHIGNARPVIVFDVLNRLLRRLYGEAHVKYVRNITDVDDKINARAAERGITIRDLTEETYRWFREDTAALNCLPPTVEPRATEHIAEMRTLIESLVASGHAYVAEEHVLFHVPSMPDYGRLSRRPLDEMVAGARVDVAPYKRDPMDFVLWKPSADGVPGWPSPCGIATPGRPGWHIECSAMSWRHLGETFDIHGGGIDLVFPHHENEIAQSRCAFHTGVMAQMWMHNGFLMLEGEKMSKSLGNFVTIRELLAEWPGEVLRLAMLSTHYRQPINWTRQGLGFAAKTLDKWYRVIGEAEAETGEGNPFEIEIADRLADDLNTPSAITHLHHLAEVAEHEETSSALRRRFKGAANLLGLLGDTETGWRARQKEAIALDEGVIAGLIADRIAARKAKNFKRADQIREELAAQGVVLMDNKDGTTSWEVSR